MTTPKLLFLFPEGWDLIALAGREALRGEHDVHEHGFDLFRFPDNAKLMWFNAPRYVDRLVARYRDAGVSAVVSTNEQFGALVAASIAERLGVYGPDPAAIVRAQHKYYARRILADALPEANPRFDVIPYRLDPARRLPLEFPLFVKPVKAAYSVLARRVDSFGELREHLTFRPWEKHIIKRLVRPFNDLMRLHTDFTIDAEHLVIEEILDGTQFNVDGFVQDGQCHVFGVVDSVMYPGTQAFRRFEYPSQLPPAVQARARTMAATVMRAIGFDHGLFNIEMFHDPARDSLKVIEINPRMASQFADLYEKVDGINLYDVLVDVARGREPRITGQRGRYGAAASFVFREFDGAVKIAPDRTQIRWLEGQYPDAYLQTYIKHGGSRRREMKWLGSYRYGIINLGGVDRDDLFRRFEHICQHVRFEAEAGEINVGGPVPRVGSGGLDPRR